MTLRRAYGATPIHLLAHALGLALAGYAVLQLLDVRGALDIAIWAVGAVLLHDAVLWPLYTVLDRVAIPRVSSMYFRVPLGLSGLLGLVWFPAIFGLGEANHERVSGLDYAGSGEAWLIASAAIFLGAGLIALLRSGSATPARPR